MIRVSTYVQYSIQYSMQNVATYMKELRLLLGAMQHILHTGYMYFYDTACAVLGRKMVIPWSQQ